MIYNNHNSRTTKSNSIGLDKTHSRSIETLYYGGPAYLGKAKLGSAPKAQAPVGQSQWYNQISQIHSKSPPTVSHLEYIGTELEASDLSRYVPEKHRMSEQLEHQPRNNLPSLRIRSGNPLLQALRI